MRGQGILLAAILLPLLGAFLLPFLGKRSCQMRNAVALALALASFGLALTMLPAVLAGVPLQWQIELPWGLTFGFAGDGLAVLTGAAAALLSAIALFYSWGSIEAYNKQNEYYMMAVLFLGAMLGAIYSTNLLFIFIFWEIAALASFRLMVFFREKPLSLKVDKVLFLSILGAIFLLLAFLKLYGETGTFVIRDFVDYIPSHFVMAFFLVGILCQAALLPCYSTLADERNFSTPVTSLFQGVLFVNIGVYVFARLFVLQAGLPLWWQTAVPILATIFSLLAAGAALAAQDMNKVLAYSTLSQLSFIFFGLSCGGAMGVAGAIWYISIYGLANGGMFLCAGIVEKATRTRDLNRLGGLGRTMPVTAFAFFVCAFSIMGLPPFGGFWAQYMLTAGTVSSGHPWLALLVLVVAVLTVIYLLRLFGKIFTGPTRYADVKEGTWEMILSVLVLAVLAIVTGVFDNSISGVAQAIVSTIGGY